MKVRAKFILTATKDDNGLMTLTGNAVCDGSEENKAFAAASPSGNFNMNIEAGMPAQDAFEVGVSKSYYLDFTLAEVSTESEDNATETGSEEGAKQEETPGADSAEA